MVSFKSSKSSKRDQLVIVSHPEDNVENGLKFTVHRPIIGNFADSSEGNPNHSANPMLVLCSSHHAASTQTKSFTTLRTRISAGEAKWGNIIKFGAEFTHIPYYWEWLEDIIRQCSDLLRKVHLLDAVYASSFLYRLDQNVLQVFCESWCPDTNSLHLAAGEASISLWDICFLGGLPIIGDFYDEVVPSMSELLESTKDGDPHLPSSCKYLFAAFHTVLSSNEKKTKVSFEDWARFWFQNSSVYQVQTKSGTKTHFPKVVGDYAELGKATTWSEKTYKALAILRIPEGDYKQTYLAAFLTCWLCSFVLPVRDHGYIRPSVFKVASLLASGHEISLAIPVLASIYRGLNDISNSATPGKNSGSFGSHFVYAWIASYFRSHLPLSHKFVGAPMIKYSGIAHPFDYPAATELLHSEQEIRWHSHSVNGVRPEEFRDQGDHSRRTNDVFLALRSSYLTLRHEDHYIVEPYSPHRFSRQFGFHQDVPGNVAMDLRDASREKLVQFFFTSIRLGTRSRFMIPLRGSNFHARVTPAYKTWWASIFLPIQRSHASSPVKIITQRRGSRERDEHGGSCERNGKRKSDALPTTPVDKAFEASLIKKKKRLIKFKTSTASPGEPATAEKLPLPTTLETKSRESKKIEAGRKEETTMVPTALAIDLDTCLEDNVLDDVLGVDHQEDFDLDDTLAWRNLDVGLEIAASNLSSNIILEQVLIEAASIPVVSAAVDCKPAEDPVAAVALEKQVETSNVTAHADKEDSPFRLKAMIADADRLVATTLGNAFKEQLLKANVGEFPEFEADLNELYGYIQARKVDISGFNACVRKYMDSTSAFHLLRQRQPSRRSELDQKRQEIGSLEGRIKDAVHLEKEKASQMHTLRSKLQEVHSRQDELKKELEKLEVQEAELQASITEVDGQYVECTCLTKSLTDAFNKIEESITTAEQEEKQLEDLSKVAAEAENALRNFEWKF